MHFRGICALVVALGLAAHDCMKAWDWRRCQVYGSRRSPAKELQIAPQQVTSDLLVLGFVALLRLWSFGRKPVRVADPYAHGPQGNPSRRDQQYGECCKLCRLEIAAIRPDSYHRRTQHCERQE